MSIIAPIETRRVKPLFSIEHITGDSRQLHLSVAVGRDHVAFAVTDAGGNRLYRLLYLLREEENGWGWSSKELDTLPETYPFLKETYQQVRVCFEFPDGMLVSTGACDNDQASVVATAISGHAGITRSEPVSGWQLQTIYKVPAETAAWVEQQFGEAWTRHQYTVGIRNIPATGAEGILYAVIRKEELIIIAASDNRVQLAQSFDYTTPEDVLYHLLNTCRHFSLDPGTVDLQVSGLLETRSALYRELHQYFRNISLRDAGWQGSDEFPAHFFTTLNDLAQCAS